MLDIIVPVGIVGAEVSMVTEELSVVAVREAVFPAASVILIENGATPLVSPASTVLVAVYEVPLPITEATPPLIVAVGVAEGVSEVVKITVITSPALANVVVALLDAIVPVGIVGAEVSTVTDELFVVVVLDAVFPAASVILIENGATPLVSPASTVLVAVYEVPLPETEAIPPLIVAVGIAEGVSEVEKVTVITFPDLANDVLALLDAIAPVGIVGAAVSTVTDELLVVVVRVPVQPKAFRNEIENGATPLVSPTSTVLVAVYEVPLPLTEAAPPFIVTVGVTAGVSEVVKLKVIISPDLANEVVVLFDAIVATVTIVALQFPELTVM